MNLEVFASDERVVPESAPRLRAEVRAFLAAERDSGSYIPRCNAWLEGHDPAFSRKLGALGWLGMTWPARYGGHERSGLERFVVIEELLAAGAPVAAHWVADRQTGPALLRYGTETQRLRFLPAIARGECCFAIGMSEPDSGSDLASVSTRAERAEGGWRVTGTKLWASHASRSHYLSLLCRTGPKGEDRHAGLSQLMVDLSAPGVLINPVRLLNGYPHFDEVVLDDAFVPDEMVLGTIGGGWAQVTAELAYERSGPERLLSTFPLLAAGLRKLDARKATEDARVGTLVANLWTLRQMSEAVATQLELGRAPELEAALVKDLGTNFEREIVEAVRLLMPREGAQWADDPDAVLLTDAVLAAPAFTLRGGTTEVLRSVVARGLGVR